MDKSKLIELRLQNLFLTRTFMSQILIVLTGGIIGLFLADITPVKIIFIALGLFADMFFLKCYVEITKNIKQILYKGE